MPERGRPDPDASPLVEIRDLRTYFYLSAGRTVKAIDGINLMIRRGSVLGLVGESGSGKSMTARSILRLLDPRARVLSGEIYFKGENLLALPEREMRKIRGNHVSMVFQDAAAALNPITRIGRQLKNAVTAHRKLSRSEAHTEALRLLDQVKLNNPEQVLSSYPYELSGGMQQRVIIAMALASGPELIIADEPTSALDVTIQKEILSVFSQLRSSRDFSMLFITHNLGVVAFICDDVCVMNQGKIVERGPAEAILEHPSHPYTQALLDAIPDPERGTAERTTISDLTW